MIDSLIDFRPDAVPTPAPTPTPSPFPFDAPPPAKFTADQCELTGPGAGAGFSFVGWIDGAELDLDSQRDLSGETLYVAIAAKQVRIGAFHDKHGPYDLMGRRVLPGTRVGRRRYGGRRDCGFGLQTLRGRIDRTAESLTLRPLRRRCPGFPAWRLPSDTPTHSRACAPRFCSAVAAVWIWVTPAEPNGPQRASWTGWGNPRRAPSRTGRPRPRALAGTTRVRTATDFGAVSPVSRPLPATIRPIDQVQRRHLPVGNEPIGGPRTPRPAPLRFGRDRAGGRGAGVPRLPLGEVVHETRQPHGRALTAGLRRSRRRCGQVAATTEAAPRYVTMPER